MGGTGFHACLVLGLQRSTVMPMLQLNARPGQVCSHLASSCGQALDGSDMDRNVSCAELKALREAAGLDLAVLARRVSLSTAQLEQLESGQDGLFYSPSIRRQAALKVYQYLDAQLQSPAAARRA
jgi:DNA-binding XRE family transcriptional regulator